MFDIVQNKNCYRYYLCSKGTNLKGKYYDTRNDATCAMYNYCAKHGLTVECTEYDKHERKYSNHKGVKFYINRVF